MVQDAIVVVPANLLTLNETVFLQIGNDPLNRTLGDANLDCHLAQHDCWIARKQNQHVGVIGQERPAMRYSSLGDWWRCTNRRRVQVARRYTRLGHAGRRHDRNQGTFDRSVWRGRIRKVIFLGHEQFILMLPQLHNRELSPRLQVGFAKSVGGMT